MSDKTFCHGGYEMACAPGTVCRGMAPCVSARPPPVRRQCKGWNYQCNGLASFCLGGQIMVGGGCDGMVETGDCRLGRDGPSL